MKEKKQSKWRRSRQGMQHFSFDIETIFEQDIKNKKKEAASLRAATNFKRVGKKGMKTPIDLMSRQERKEHMRAGEIVTTNIFDTILPIAEFEALEEHEQRNRLAYWRTKYTNKEICTGLNIWNNKYYKLVADLGLPKAPRTNSGEKVIRKAPIKRTQAPPVAIQSSLELEAPPLQEIIVNGLHLSLNGTYTPEQIVKQLLKFGSLLEGEEDNYYIELKLMQKTK